MVFWGVLGDTHAFPGQVALVERRALERDLLEIKNRDWEMLPRGRVDLRRCQASIRDSPNQAWTPGDTDSGWVDGSPGEDSLGWGKIPSKRSFQRNLATWIELAWPTNEPEKWFEQVLGLGQPIK